MKNEFRVINRTTREEQIFNSKELERFFHCEYDKQTQKIKYKNHPRDYARSKVKQPIESWLEVLGFALLGMAIIIIATEIVMQWK
jgi:hypothetical protein